MKRIIFMFESAVLWKGIIFIEKESKIRLYPSKESSPNLAELDEDTEYINIYAEVVKELKRLDVYTDIVKNILERMEFRPFKTGNVIASCKPWYKTDIVETSVSSVLQDITRQVASYYVMNNITAKNIIKYGMINGNYIDIIYDWHNAKYEQEFLKDFKLSNEIQSMLYRLMSRNEVSVDLRDKYYLRFISNVNNESFGYPISDNVEGY